MILLEHCVHINDTDHMQLRFYDDMSIHICLIINNKFYNNWATIIKNNGKIRWDRIVDKMILSHQDAIQKLADKIFRMRLFI
jgi:hypothetical protein